MDKEQHVGQTKVTTVNQGIIIYTYGIYTHTYMRPTVLQHLYKGLLCIYNKSTEYIYKPSYCYSNVMYQSHVSEVKDMIY